MDIVGFLNENFWLVVTMISTITLPVTNGINTKFNLNKVWKQICAWGVSIILTFGVYIGQFATFNEPEWISVPLTGIICGLSANGIYDIPTVKAFIQKYFSAKK